MEQVCQKYPLNAGMAPVDHLFLATVVTVLQWVTRCNPLDTHCTATGAVFDD